MKITVLNDTDAKGGDNAEARVSASPDTVKGYVASGHDVTVVKGAGFAANFSDADYKAAGASIAATNAAAAKAADHASFWHDQLDVHLAAARWRTDVRGSGADGGRSVFWWFGRRQGGRPA